MVWFGWFRPLYDTVARGWSHGGVYFIVQLLTPAERHLSRVGKQLVRLSNTSIELVGDYVGLKSLFVGYLNLHVLCTVSGRYADPPPEYPFEFGIWLDEELRGGQDLYVTVSSRTLSHDIDCDTCPSFLPELERFIPDGILSSELFRRFLREVETPLVLGSDRNEGIKGIPTIIRETDAFEDFHVQYSVRYVAVEAGEPSRADRRRCSWLERELDLDKLLATWFRTAQENRGLSIIRGAMERSFEEALMDVAWV